MADGSARETDDGGRDRGRGCGDGSRDEFGARSDVSEMRERGSDEGRRDTLDCED